MLYLFAAVVRVAFGRKVQGIKWGEVSSERPCVYCRGAVRGGGLRGRRGYGDEEEEGVEGVPLSMIGTGRDSTRTPEFVNESVLYRRLSERVRRSREAHRVIEQARRRFSEGRNAVRLAEETERKSAQKADQEKEDGVPRSRRQEDVEQGDRTDDGKAVREDRRKKEGARMNVKLGKNSVSDAENRKANGKWVRKNGQDGIKQRTLPAEKVAEGENKVWDEVEKSNEILRSTIADLQAALNYEIVRRRRLTRLAWNHKLERERAEQRIRERAGGRTWLAGGPWAQPRLKRGNSWGPGSSAAPGRRRVHLGEAGGPPNVPPRRPRGAGGTRFYRSTGGLTFRKEIMELDRENKQAIGNYVPNAAHRGSLTSDQLWKKVYEPVIRAKEKTLKSSLKKGRSKSSALEVTFDLPTKG